jgi:hypothetical protein
MAARNMKSGVELYTCVIMLILKEFQILEHFKTYIFILGILSFCYSFTHWLISFWVLGVFCFVLFVCFWGITDKAIVNESLCSYMVSFLLCKYLGVQWVSLVVSVCSVFKKSAKCFPGWLYYFYSHQNCIKQLVKFHAR